MGNNYGKIIGKVDESKKFQQKCLAYNGNHVGKGIDIETLYYAKEMDVDGHVSNNGQYKYYVFEYLKNDCNYNVNPINYTHIPTEPVQLRTKFTPWKSDPNRYTKNWRKFLSLYNLSMKLDGQLVLVNYSDGFIKDSKTNQSVPAVQGFDQEVKVMYVDTLDWDVLKELSTSGNSKSKDYIIFSQIKYMTFEEYAIWLQKMNENCKLPDVYNQNNIPLFQS